MKALKDIVLKVKIIKNFYEEIWWEVSNKDLGLNKLDSDFFKTKKAALKNCDAWMKLNGFRYEVVE